MSAPTPYRELIDVVTSLPLIMRETRRARGHSQREVGRLTGISFATVNRLERHTGPDAPPLDVSSLIPLLTYLDPQLPPTPAVPAPPQTERLPIEGDTDDTP